MTLREAWYRAQLRTVARLVLRRVYDSATIARELGVTPRHVRRLLRDERLWQEYEPIRDRWQAERMAEMKAMWLARLGLS